MAPATAPGTEVPLAPMIDTSNSSGFCQLMKLLHNRPEVRPLLRENVEDSACLHTCECLQCRALRSLQREIERLCDDNRRRFSVHNRRFEFPVPRGIERRSIEKGR